MNDRPDSEQRPTERVAIVYQVLHHFRAPIFTKLVRARPGAPAYHLFAAAENTLDNNRTMDPALAALPDHDGGLPWTFVRNRHLGGPFFWQTGVLRASLARDTQVMIFLGNMYYLSTWLGASLARLRGKRVLFWGHGYTRRESGFQGWVRERFYRLGHGVLLYGERARGLMIERGFPEDSLYVVYNSLDYDRQRQVRDANDEDSLRSLRARLFREPDLPILVCIGRVEPRKQLEQLIDATRSLDDEGLRVNLLIIGDGSARSRLEERARDRRLDGRIHFYGACYDEAEVGPLLMASSLCVCPAALGLTAIHAMAYGLPVLSHDALDRQGPEVEAIVPGETGALYADGDPCDLRRRIREWLDEHPDRSEVSRRCIEVIENRYSAARQVRVIDQAVRGVPAGDVDREAVVPASGLQREGKAAEG